MTATRKKNVYWSKLQHCSIATIRSRETHVLGEFAFRYTGTFASRRETCSKTKFIFDLSDALCYAIGTEVLSNNPPPGFWFD